MAWWQHDGGNGAPPTGTFWLCGRALARCPWIARCGCERTQDDPLTVYDPVCQAAARELVAQYSVLPDQPVYLRLDSAPAVSTWAGPRGCGPSAGRCWPN